MEIIDSHLSSLNGMSVSDVKAPRLSSQSRIKCLKVQSYKLKKKLKTGPLQLSHLKTLFFLVQLNFTHF